ncbi:MAG: hypothetical protein K9J21_12480, partial [Bacteroidales bacterium]|nr:hypothetical protein [Bacteroidales bacterium]
ITSWNNKGNSGGSFSATQSIRQPNYNMEGVRANGNSALKYNNTLSIDGISAFDLLIVHRAPYSSLEGATAIDIANAIQMTFLDGVNGRVKNSSGFKQPPETNAYDNWGLNNGFIIEHLRLDSSSGDLIFYQDNNEVGRISSFGTVSTSYNQMMLFTTIDDNFNYCYAGQVWGVYAHFGSNIDRNNVYDALVNRY